RIHQHLVVRASAPAGPYPSAGLDVVRVDATAHAELTTGNTRQHLVLEDVRRVCVGLTDLRVPVLHGPDDLAGLRIERDQRGVGLLQEDLAVAIGEPTVYRVATHHGNDIGVLLRLILPTERLVLQVHAVHVVGK